MADNLDVIVRRARAATRGSWQLGDRAVNGEWWFGTVTDPDDVTEPGVPLGVCGTREDGDFVVHAREDILWLAGQVRDRDVALQAAEDRIAELEAVARMSVKGARCGADITHRDEGHRQSVCRLPVDHFDAHDDLDGCRWTDATTRHRPAEVTGDGDPSGLSPEAAAAAVAATANLADWFDEVDACGCCDKGTTAAMRDALGAAVAVCATAASGPDGPARLTALQVLNRIWWASR